LCSLIEADMLQYEKLKLLWKQQDELVAAREAFELEYEHEGRRSLAPIENPFRNLLLQHQDRRVMRLVEEKKYINYSDFKERYWPQFKKAYKPEVTPALVYSEILGVIKGSLESVSCPNRYLSEAQYLTGLVRRVSDQLDLETREQIYSIFKQYKKIAGAAYELDMADRVHCLLDFVNQVNAVEISPSKSNLTCESESDSDGKSDKPEDGEDSEASGRDGIDINRQPKPSDGLEAEKPTREYYEDL
ncbi:unnamed protein product, partial [Rhizoctonia solani]